jgi:hypothetical protein
MSSEYGILVGKPDEKRPLGRPRCKWEDIIKIDIKKKGYVWSRFIWLRIGAGNRLLWSR